MNLNAFFLRLFFVSNLIFIELQFTFARESELHPLSGSQISEISDLESGGSYLNIIPALPKKVHSTEDLSNSHRPVLLQKKQREPKDGEDFSVSSTFTENSDESKESEQPHESEETIPKFKPKTQFMSGKQAETTMIPNIDIVKLKDEKNSKNRNEKGKRSFPMNRTNEDDMKMVNLDSTPEIEVGRISSKHLFSSNEFNEFERNSKRGSFLLTSDTELDTQPFIIPVKTDKADRLELQEDFNVSHEAAVSRKAVDRSVYVLPAVSVDIAEGTSLLLNANVRKEIYYEVTNNLNSMTRISYTVRDEAGILQQIDKFVSVLGPHESTTVRLAVLPRTNLGTDRITFLASGSEQVRKEVIVDIDNFFNSDDSYPDVDYTYTSDCTDVLLSKCQHGTWTIKISARDDESGLMLLTTIPKGLYVPDGYTAGTKEEVTGFYSDTCCNPDIQIVAVDRMNNRIVKQANAYRAPLGFWAVAAIILVSIILIALILTCIIFCVRRYKKNEGDSFDLPTYRGGTRF